jgi:hypothetical protein
MAVISIKNKIKSGSLLVGNAPFIPNDYESIATVTVGSGGASSIDFTSIPSTYQHLQIRILARGAAATNFISAGIRFNSDTGSNYAIHQLLGSGSAASSGSDINITSIYRTFIPAANQTSGRFGAGVVDILDYANTNKNKTTRTLTGFDLNGSGYIILRSGLWRSTSAVSSITLFDADNAGGFAEYSSFALYGIKG